LASEVNKVRIDSILESFFAGCRKYDLYELAQKYYTINPNDIFEIQKELQYQDVTTERIEYVKQQVKTGVDATPDTQVSSPGVSNFNGSEYNNLGFYFDNDIPKPNVTVSSYETYYGGYIAEKPVYQSSSPKTDVPYSSSAAQTGVFFTDVIENNFSQLTGMATKLLNMFTSNPASTAVLNLFGSASAPANITYNTELSQRRIESVVKWLSEFTIGDKKLGQDMKGGEGRLIIDTDAVGEQVKDVKPLGKGNQTYGPYNCTDGDKDTKQTHAQKIYTVNTKACRRIGVTLTVNNNPPDTLQTKPGIKTAQFCNTIVIQNKIKTNTTKK